MRGRARGEDAGKRQGGARETPPHGEDYCTDWDETFAFIAGRTEAGFAFGVTWEELASSSPLQEPDEDDVPF